MGEGRGHGRGRPMSDIVHDAEYCILAGSKRGEFRRAGTSYASAPREEEKCGKKDSGKASDNDNVCHELMKGCRACRL
jgi:hypothetical protein